MSKEKPFEILRFDILLFCGSLFRTGEVSYKNTAGLPPEITPAKAEAGVTSGTAFP